MKKYQKSSNHWNQKAPDSVFVHENGKLFHIELLVPFEIHLKSILLDQTFTLISSGSQIILIDNRKSAYQIIEMPDKVISLTKNNNEVFVGMVNEGVHCFEFLSGALNFVESHLKGCSVSSVLKDEQGGTWVSTLNYGTKYIKIAGRVISSRPNDHHISAALQLNDKEVCFITYGGNLFTVSEKTFNNPHFVDNLGFSCREIKSDSRGVVWMSSESFYSFSNGSIVKYPFNVRHVDFDFIDESNNIIMSRGLSKIIDKEFVKKGEDRNFHAICTVSKDSFYLGDNYGAYLYTDGVFQSLADENPVFNIRVSEIERLENTYFFATRGNGVIIKKNNEIDVVNQDNGLLFNQVNNLSVSNNQLFVATHFGVSCIDLKTHTVHNFTKKEGLIDNEVIDITSTKDHIWVGTKSGLQCIPKATFFAKPVDQPILIRRISTVDTTYDSSPEKIILKHDKSYLSLSFTDFDYNDLNGDATYRYTLNEGGDWQESQTNKLSFPYFSPGHYRLMLQKKNIEGKWSSTSSPIFIEVVEPLYNQTWFRVILIGFVVFIISAIIYNRIKRNQIKQANANQLLLLKNKAMSSQMNPHFIFNSLNSIQSYILKNERKLSAKYLSKFAKLIRCVLEYSERTYVTISEELEALQIYLDIEKLRFENPLNIQFIIDEKIDPNKVLIPPFLIQPLVENAIWHGVSSIESAGEITIALKLDNGLLKCNVSDNGKGLTEKDNNQKKEHRSFSMENCRQRLILFHENKVDAELRIENIIENNCVRGVSSTFNLPYKLKQ